MSVGPKEGIYLDAALAVIGEQVDERIDEISRRRRRRGKVALAVLALATVLSGSAAAYAVTVVAAHARVTEQHAVAIVAGEARCADAGQSDAFFTAHYRASADSALSESALCAAVRADLVADPRRYEALTPDGALAAAATLLTDAGGVDITVQKATFSPVAAGGGR